MHKLDKAAQNALKKIYTQFTSASKVYVSTPEYKKTIIDYLAKDGLIETTDASTLSGWSYLVRPTHEGELVYSEILKLPLSKIEDFISQGEIIMIEEYHHVTEPGLVMPDYISGPKSDQWFSEICIFNDRNLADHPLHDQIEAVCKNHRKQHSPHKSMMGYLRALAKDEEFFEKSEQRKDVTSMGFNKLPSNSEQLLRGLLEATNRTEYLAERFKNTSDNKDEELRGIIRELKEKGYIDVQWADDLPYHVTLNNSARTYFERIPAQIPTVGKEENNSIMALYDVFISYANADKNDYVNQLKESLDKLGIQIFYDQDSIEWGDRWKEMIVEGVQKAEFAIIVISENFFGREWTEKELQEFLNRQNTSGQKIILPILHNITFSQLQKQYPTVADIHALNSSNYSCDEIALKFAGQLIKRLRT